jgi:hypothetical protein
VTEIEKDSSLQKNTFESIPWRLRIVGSIFLLVCLALVVAWQVAREREKAALAETPEHYALRFAKAVLIDLDDKLATEMLCQDGYPQLRANTDMWLDFWSQDGVVVPPHNIRVARSLDHPPFPSSDRPVRKVYVAYSYSFEYEGTQRDLDYDDGWPIYVTIFEDGYCAAPWGGE